MDLERVLFLGKPDRSLGRPKPIQSVAGKRIPIAELHDRSIVALTNELTRCRPGSVKRTFSMPCHRVCIRARQYKYLRLTTNEQSINLLDGSMDLRLDKDNSVLSRVIKVREFIFTDKVY